MGAPILIETQQDIVDPLEIAKLEFKKGVVPLTVRRKLPGGEYVIVKIVDLAL